MEDEGEEDSSGEDGNIRFFKIPGLSHNQLDRARSEPNPPTYSICINNGQTRLITTDGKVPL